MRYYTFAKVLCWHLKKYVTISLLFNHNYDILHPYGIFGKKLADYLINQVII